jgi:hypothetical protein
MAYRIRCASSIFSSEISCLRKLSVSLIQRVMTSSNFGKEKAAYPPLQFAEHVKCLLVLIQKQEGP